MKKENKYNFEELVQDESFRMWVLKNERNPFWENFAIDSQENARMVENAKSFLLLFDYNEKKISDDFIDNEFDDLKFKLDIKKPNKPKNLFVIAASVFIIVLISSGIFYNFDSEFKTYKIAESDFEGLIEQVNNSNSPKFLTLSDGSSVILQPKSKLSYSKDFDEDSREVFLEGEAFFEVTKNSIKPFLVYSSGVLTKVYGTSFRVVAFDEQDLIKVIVKTGKVKIRKSVINNQDDLKEITLLPNQAALFNKKDDLFQKVTEFSNNLEIESSLNKVDQIDFHFVDTHISEIFSMIQDVYNIKVEYPDAVFENCFVTTSLTDVPLPEKLKILSFSIGVNTSYEIIGNKIIIKSDGCIPSKLNNNKQQ
ncbi:MAG: FecR family protein [Alphaproteobacteria bacterium]